MDIKGENIMECLEYMETEEFKAIEILNDLRDCSSVRFLDETLDEAIKQLRVLIEDYMVTKKQNDYYNLEGRSCNTCKSKNCDIKRDMLNNGTMNPNYFWCVDWEEEQ